MAGPLGHNRGPKLVLADEALEVDDLQDLLPERPPVPDEEKTLKDRIEELKPLTEKDLLRRAQVALYRTLTVRAEAGTITAAEAQVLRNLLKDNGLIMGFEPEGDKEASEFGDFDPPDFESPSE